MLPLLLRSEMPSQVYMKLVENMLVEPFCRTVSVKSEIFGSPNIHFETCTIAPNSLLWVYILFLCQLLILTTSVIVSFPCNVQIVPNKDLHCLQQIVLEFGSIVD